MILQLFISNNTFRQSCTFLSIPNLLVIQKISIFACRNLLKKHNYVKRKGIKDRTQA